MASEFEQLGFILDDMFDVPEPCVDDSADGHMMTLFDTNVELDSWNPLIGASSFTGAWDAAEPAGTHNGERFDASPCGVMETSALAPAVEDFETVTKDFPANKFQCTPRGRSQRANHRFTPTRRRATTFAARGDAVACHDLHVRLRVMRRLLLALAGATARWRCPYCNT